MKTEKIVRQTFNTLLPVPCMSFVGGTIIVCIGENPLTVYGLMLKNTLFEWEGLIRTLHFASPLALTGLAIGITFKTNIFNMGIEGQMLGGAFTACVLGFTLQGLSSVMHIGACLLAGAVCGMLLAVIPALLKAYLYVSEVVVTLMLNYAIIEILRVLLQTTYRDPTPGYASTPPVLSSAMMNRLGGTNLTAFFPVTMVVFVLMYLVFNKSRLGYEIKSIDRNPEFAGTSDMSVAKKIVVMMLISGALSGLAGSGFTLNEKFKYTLNFSGTPGLGWDGMLISLLGGHSPIGTSVVAIFYSTLKAGSDTIGIFANVPKEIVGVIQGLLVLFLSVRFIDEHAMLFSRPKVKFPSRGRKEATST